MALPDPDKVNEGELRDFLVASAQFFQWNSGKNTPNIPIDLSQRIGAFGCIFVPDGVTRLTRLAQSDA